MFEVESLDRMSLNASSLMLLIPSFRRGQRWERCTHRKHPLPSPRNTLNEGNRAAAVAPLHSAQDHSHPSKSGGVRRSPRSCRRRRGATSTCKDISHLSYGRSKLIYVFHAPDISITTSRLSVEATSVWYFLCRT